MDGEVYCIIEYEIDITNNLNIDYIFIDYLQKKNMIEKLEQYYKHCYKFIYNNKIIYKIQDLIENNELIIEKQNLNKSKNFLPTEINITLIKEEYIQICTTKYAFTALYSKDIIISWGDNNYGGYNNMIKDKLNNVKYLYSNTFAFLVIKYDNSILIWGNNRCIGSTGVIRGNFDNFGYIEIDQTKIKELVSFTDFVLETKDLSYDQQIDNNFYIKKIYTTDYSFAILNNKGKALLFGGIFNDKDINYNDELENINDIYSTSSLYIFHMFDNTLKLISSLTSFFKIINLETPIKSLFTSQLSFAILDSNKNVLSFYDLHRYELLNPDLIYISDDNIKIANVKNIVSTNISVFFAFTNDGIIYKWKNNDKCVLLLKNIKEIYNNLYTLVAISNNNELIIITKNEQKIFTNLKKINVYFTNNFFVIIINNSEWIIVKNNIIYDSYHHKIINNIKNIYSTNEILIILYDNDYKIYIKDYNLLDTKFKNHYNQNDIIKEIYCNNNIFVSLTTKNKLIFYTDKRNNQNNYEQYLIDNY